MSPESSIPHPLLLLADDDDDAIFFFERYFRHVCNQWEFASVKNGQAALEFIKKVAKPDVLITDLSMPAMDGFELISQIRAEDKLQKLPIVVYTSSALPADRKRSLEMGADGYFCKQPSLTELKSLIKYATSLPKVEPESPA